MSGYSFLRALGSLLISYAAYTLCLRLWSNMCDARLVFNQPAHCLLIGNFITRRFQESSATGLIWAPHEPEAV